jgi:hypothetical protein
MRSPRDKVWEILIFIKPESEESAMLSLLETALNEFFLTFAIPVSVVHCVEMPWLSNDDTPCFEDIEYTSLYNPITKNFYGYTCFPNELSVFSEPPHLAEQMKLFRQLVGYSLLSDQSTHNINEGTRKYEHSI